MLQESQRKKNELLVTFGVQKSFPGVTGSVSTTGRTVNAVVIQKAKPFLFVGLCFEDYSYVNLTYFSPVPTGHVLLFRFLFIKDQLNIHLLLKNIKSGNSVIKPAAAAAKSLQLCPTLCDPIDTPGKNTGVGCHFLLQCRKVKSESEVAQLCPTLCDPMDCSLPGSSIHGIFQARVPEWGAIAFSSNQGQCCVQSLSHVQFFATPWTVAHQAPLSMGILQTRILEWVATPSSRGSSQPED